jgi:hypothetical protein
MKMKSHRAETVLIFVVSKACDLNFIARPFTEKSAVVRAPTNFSPCHIAASAAMEAVARSIFHQVLMKFFQSQPLPLIRVQPIDIVHGMNFLKWYESLIHDVVI